MNIILSMTLSGSIVYIVYRFFEFIRIVYFSPRNRYFILKAILFFHFIPMGYLSRKLSRFFLSKSGQAYGDTFVNGSKPAVIFTPSERYINAAYRNHTLIIGIWFLIAAAIFLNALWVRNKLRKLILNFSDELTSDEVLQILARGQSRLNIKGKIRIYSVEADVSPFTYGLFHPMIVIPHTYDIQALELTVYHELVHIKRKDSFIFFLRTLTMGIYWFNPLVFFIYRKINSLCELSCDEIVIRNMEKEEKLNYSRLIISAADTSTLSSRHITPFSKNQKIIKERIDFIMTDKRRKNRFRLAPVILSAGILLTSTFPVFAYEPPKELKLLDSVTEDNISIVSSDNFVEFTASGSSAQTTTVPVKYIKYDFQFTDKYGNIYPAGEPSSHAECKHSFITGTYTTHIKNDDGSCIVRNYDAKRCTKCGAITDRVLASTYQYVKCPH